MCLLAHVGKDVTAGRHVRGEGKWLVICSLTEEAERTKRVKRGVEMGNNMSLYKL